MYEELKRIPYLGVFPLFFKALKRAFSAPRIWTVEAGYLAKLVKLPAWQMSLAPTFSPIKEVSEGATAFILSLMYCWRLSLYSYCFNTWSQKLAN